MKSNLISLKYTPTDLCKADKLTKSLQRLKYLKFCEQMRFDLKHLISGVGNVIIHNCDVILYHVILSINSKIAKIIMLHAFCSIIQATGFWAFRLRNENYRIYFKKSFGPERNNDNKKNNKFNKMNIEDKI